MKTEKQMCMTYKEYKQNEFGYTCITTFWNFRNLVDHFGDNPAAMQQAGIAYATDQIIDLIANGITNIHVYSMNKPEVAIAIMENLSEIIK